MSSWGARRKAWYIGTTLILVSLVVGLSAYLFLSREPLCDDLIQNGDEEGIDCGGSCLKLCVAPSPIVLWTRHFELAPGIYSAATYVENPQIDSYVPTIAYVFKLFDAQNLLVAERRGVAAIAPTRVTPIVETNIAAGTRVPVRAFFEFTEVPEWSRAEATPRIDISNQVFDPSARKVEATVTNAADREVRGLPVVATLFDANGVAQGASKATIARLPRGGQERVVFTWPPTLAGTAVRAEIVALPTP